MEPLTRNEFNLIFTVDAHGYEDNIKSISYLLDYGDVCNVDYVPRATYTVKLQDVREGNRWLKVVAFIAGFYAPDGPWSLKEYEFGSFSEVSFEVNTGPPIISVLSPENKTYDTSSIQLNFTINEAASQINYSLDGTENVTIAGNTTLTDLPNGDHNVIVYATDEAGNVGISETISFSVAVPKPFHPTLVALVLTASGAATTVVGLSLLVYFKKRKH